MAIVPIRIHGREYSIACDDGQEDHLLFLSQQLDKSMQTLVKGMGGDPGEVMSLLLTALMIEDELVENKKEIKRLRAQTNESRLMEIESAIATTLENIASRIENIAERMEIR